jgi:23S rRNA pseudouridine955/2504/2580 synthase
VPQHFVLDNVEVSVRLTKWLQNKFNITYAAAQQLIRKAAVKVNNQRVKQDCRLSNGDLVTVHARLLEFKRTEKKAPDTAQQAALLKALKANVLVQDENIIALNKPYGVATQGGTGVKISIDDALDGLSHHVGIRPRLVHRLDRETTGVLLIARNKQAAIELAEQFKANQITKKYLALVVGHVSPYSGTIRDRVAKAGSLENAKPAVTRYRVLASSKGVSLVEFIPLTGRTHQIRIHAAQSLGSPIVGDMKYGGKDSLPPVYPKKNLCLHSYETTVNLFGKAYHIKAPLPEHMLQAIEAASISLPATDHKEKL